MRTLLFIAATTAVGAGILVAACVGDDTAKPADAGCEGTGCADADGGSNNTTTDGATSDTSTPVDAGSDACTSPCNGELVWLRSFGSTAGDQVLEATVDSAGNTILLANGGGTIAFGEDGGAPTLSAGATFVAKLDPDGKALWVKALGGVVLQPHIAVSPAGNIFIAGTYFKNVNQTLPITWDGSDTGLPNNVGASGYDIFVLEVDSAGAQRLAVQIGAASYDEMRAIGVDHDGSPVIFGQMAADITYRSTTINAGPFVLELDANNFNPKWVHRIQVQNAGNVRAVSIAPMGTGDLGVTGTYGGEVNWGSGFQGSSTAPVATDAFLVRLKSADGSLVFSNQNFLSLYGNNQLGAGNPAVTHVSGMAYGGTASVALVGQFHGWVGLGNTTPFLQVGDAGLTTRDPGTYLAVFNATTFLPLGYRGIFDGTSAEEKRVAVDKDGFVSVAGSFVNAVDYGGGALTSAGAGDGFVALYDSNLQKHVWSKRFGGPIADRAVGLGVDPSSGAVIVAGEYQATADFPGGKQLVSNGGVKNMFVMKLAR